MQGVFSAAIRVVSGFTLLSRFAGLARDIITARIVGDTALGSAFRAAYAIPNLFRRLFGEGALSAAFLPEYTVLRRDDPRAADQLASLVLRLLMLSTGGLTLILEAVLFVLWLLHRSDPDQALSLRFMMLMLPMMPMVCITAILGGILQAHGRFAVPAAAPILLNLFQIGAGLLFYAGVVTDRTTAAYVIAVAAVAASIAQIAWSLAGIRGQIRWTRMATDAQQAIANVRARFLPALIGLGTLQLNTFLDMVIAMWPSWFGDTMFGRPTPLDRSSNAILSFTQTIYQFPLGVFGLAVATAVFPLLSRAAARPAEFIDTLRRGVRLSMFIGLPASVGLVLTRHELIAVLFGGTSDRSTHGFSPEGLDRAAAVLAGFATAVWAYSVNHTLTRAFYAKGDTTTPMRIAMAAVALNLGLNLTLIWSLREAGLAWATAISAVLQTFALFVSLGRRHGVHPLDRSTVAALFRIVALTGLMAAAVVGASHLLPAAAAPGSPPGTGLWTIQLLRLGVLCTVGAGVFAAAAWLLRVPEIRWLMERPPKGADGKVAGISFE